MTVHLQSVTQYTPQCFVLAQLLHGSLNLASSILRTGLRYIVGTNKCIPDCLLSEGWQLPHIIMYSISSLYLHSVTKVCDKENLSTPWMSCKVMFLPLKC